MCDSELFIIWLAESCVINIAYFTMLQNHYFLFCKKLMIAVNLVMMVK